LDVERDRAPLGELRQVAEASLDKNDRDERVPLRKTGCLGPCSEGHMMGLAHEEEGVYLFKQMNDEESVKQLANVANKSLETGTITVPPALKSHLEAKLSPRSIPEIPFED